MALSDDELLDFNEKELDHFDRTQARASLAKHGDAFRLQLITARHLEFWAKELESHKSISSDAQRDAGVVWGLRQVAANLRQGDYLPGGVFYDQVVGD